MPSKTGSLLYAQLSEQQMHVLSSENAEVVLSDALGSFIGPEENREFYEVSLTNLKGVVAGLAIGEYLVIGYVRWANRGAERRSKRSYETFVLQLKKGLVAFLRQSELDNLQIGDFDRGQTEKFLTWLKQPERETAPNTQRKYFGVAKALFTELKKYPDTKALLGDIAFRNNPFPDAHHTTKKTDRLDDITFGQFYRACKADITEIIGKLRPAWEFLDSGEYVYPDETRKGRGRYADILSVWSWLREKIKITGVVPSLKELKAMHVHLHDAVVHIHGYADSILPFYPTPEQLFPFVSLQAVYTHANNGPLWGLQRSDMSRALVMDVERIVYNLEKNRGIAYERSFVVDETDVFSPEQLQKVIDRWTHHIRPLAGKHVGHVHIFVTQERSVRGFLTAEYDGTDSDQCWKQAAKNFSARHGLPAITMREIRTTGLDIVREITNDDMRAVMSVSGHAAEGTVSFHYEGAPAKRRREEKLAKVMVVYHRWAATEGKVDPRGVPEKADLLAATPGWHCFDPFDSPVPGEIKGRSCQAFGRCPGCELGFVDITSHYALARLVQLTNELKRARLYLKYDRWRDAYERPLEMLLESWLPAFTSEEVQKAAATLSLNPIGKVE